MENYGVFLSFRSTNAALAGRIYDYLKHKGCEPYQYTYNTKLVASDGYRGEILEQVKAAPCFICVLSKDIFKPCCEECKCRKPNDCDERIKNNLLLEEIKTAFENKKYMAFIGLNNFNIPKKEELPYCIKDIFNRTYANRLRKDHSNFRDIMDDIYTQICISCGTAIDEKLDFKHKLHYAQNICLVDRNTMSESFTTHDRVFGKDYMNKIKNNEGISDEDVIIKKISSLSYANSSLFYPYETMIDPNVYDYVPSFAKAIRGLFNDKRFILEVVVNSPESTGQKDAIAQNKLGNDALITNPRDVFTLTFGQIMSHIEMDADKNTDVGKIFQNAAKKKHFFYYFIDDIIPCAIMIVEYKKGYEKFNHVKVDWYTPIRNTAERLTMCIFKSENSDLYDFFVKLYEKYFWRYLSTEDLNQKKPDWMNNYLEVLERQVNGDPSSEIKDHFKNVKEYINKRYNNKK